MAKLQAAIIVAVFTVLFLGINVEAKKRNQRDIHIVSNVNPIDWLCENNPWGSYFSWCSATTTTTQTSTTTKPTAGNTGTTMKATGTTLSTTTVVTTTTTPSPLASAHWCRFSNGTYLALGQTFMQMPCVICQCSQNHNILCNSLQCMPTACIDNMKPTVKTGDCCPTCSYETQAFSCNQGGVIFPHGTIIKKVNNNGICWCQSGTIECRQTVISTTTYTSWDYLSNGTTAYVIVIVICLVLLLGTLLCCGCGLLYYYYYQNQQQAVQQAYEQYYNNAGWQPMTEDGQLGDATDKEKEATGEQSFAQNYPTGHSAEYVPPPYAIYSGAYGTQEPKRV